MLAERRDALFAALAETADVRTGSEVDIAHRQNGELACSQAGLAGKRQHRSVASPVQVPWSVASRSASISSSVVSWWRRLLPRRR